MFLILTVGAVAASAQTFAGLYQFCAQTNCTDGYAPVAPVTQGLDGNLYGTTLDGGAHSAGTAFKVTPHGVLTTLHSFCNQSSCADGSGPYAGLLLATDGLFYGTTLAYGGAPGGGGTIFRLTSGGAGILFSFCAVKGCRSGATPYAPLIQGTDGNFYGTTTCCGLKNGGAIFKVTPQKVFTVLYTFCSQTNCTDGSYPRAGLVQAPSGDFFGMTTLGGQTTGQVCGTGGCGTVFRITPTGVLTTLYTFCAATNGTNCTDGAYPLSALVQGADGNFYGTTNGGGNNNTACQSSGCGTVFKITPAGKLTTLHRFCAQSGCPDGYSPYAGLTQGTDGKFYGTVSAGGTASSGTVFRITAAGSFTILHTFSGPDGKYPDAALVQSTSGTFYSTTSRGGGNNNTLCVYGCGTVFSLNVGLGPFIETVPTAGKVGATVTILGTDLTGATSVSFHGTVATFTVVSATEITTTVPADATTGKVTVTTPRGTLTSNVVFRVI